MKRILAILLILLLCLSACAPKEEDQIIANNNSVPQQEQVEQEEPSDTPADSTAQTPTTDNSADGQPTPQRPAPSTPDGDKDPEDTVTDTPVTPGNTNDTTQEKDDSLVDLATDVRFFGRTYEENGVYWFNWTESGFEFSFNGTGAEAMLESENNGEDHIAFIRIYIDGREQPKSVAITDSMQTVELCKGLKKGNHTLRVVKRTNARSASLGVSDITLAKGGKVLPPPTAKERRIEFIGDSLTVGYGTLGNDSTAAWSTATEDGSCTFAALTGKALNADYNVVAISGRGLAHNTGGDTDKLMPALYTKVDEYNYPGHDWDFSSFVPDVVVIHLGNNDHSTSSESEVTEAAKKFYATVRKKNPNAHIIVAYGLSGNKMEAAIKSAVNGMGDSKLTYLALPNATEKVLGHPAKSAHKAGAEVLIKEVRRVTGWKD